MLSGDVAKQGELLRLPFWRFDQWHASLFPLHGLHQASLNQCLHVLVHRASGTKPQCITELIQCGRLLVLLMTFTQIIVDRLLAASEVVRHGGQPSLGIADGAAVAKAAVMGVFGAFVLGQLVYKVVYPQLPTLEAMGAVGALALAVNGACFALLWRHRGEDINMRSVWLCSRNDLIANLSVLLAAWTVWATASPWPDIAVGALICTMFLRSAFVVAQEAHEDLRSTRAQPL